MPQKKILVTGGSGYVGSLLVPKLLKLNHKVVVIDTFWYGDVLREHPNLKSKNIQPKTKDLKGIDQVIHLAGILRYYFKFNTKTYLGNYLFRNKNFM